MDGSSNEPVCAAVRCASRSAVLKLPTDWPRTPSLCGKKATFCVPFSRELTGQLHEFAAERGYPLLAALLGAWTVLLTRWSGQESLTIGIGSPLAPLSLDLTDDPTGALLLTRITQIQTLITGESAAAVGEEPFAAILSFESSSVADTPQPHLILRYAS